MILLYEYSKDFQQAMRHIQVVTIQQPCISSNPNVIVESLYINLLNMARNILLYWKQAKLRFGLVHLI